MTKVFRIFRFSQQLHFPYYEYFQISKASSKEFSFYFKYISLFKISNISKYLHFETTLNIFNFNKIHFHINDTRYWSLVFLS
jgi:hypothetical protein